MNPTSYTDRFVGHVSLSYDGRCFISDVRKALRHRGFRLVVRGGNPNRKQFVGTTFVNRGFSYTLRHSALRETIPLPFSTYARLYLRLSAPFPYELTLKSAKAVVSDLRNRYVRGGRNITSGIPTKVLS